MPVVGAASSGSSRSLYVAYSRARAKFAWVGEGGGGGRGGPTIQNRRLDPNACELEIGGMWRIVVIACFNVFVPTGRRCRGVARL